MTLESWPTETQSASTRSPSLGDPSSFLQKVTANIKIDDQYDKLIRQLHVMTIDSSTTCYDSELLLRKISEKIIRACTLLANNQLILSRVLAIKTSSRQNGLVVPKHDLHQTSLGETTYHDGVLTRVSRLYKLFSQKSMSQCSSPMSFFLSYKVFIKKQDEVSTSDCTR